MGSIEPRMKNGMLQCTCGSTDVMVVYVQQTDEYRAQCVCGRRSHCAASYDEAKEKWNEEIRKGRYMFVTKKGADI